MKFYEACKAFREKRGVRLVDVARDTGYSVQNISAFEHGRTSNASIYNYYLNHIVDCKELVYKDSDSVVVVCDEVPDFIIEQFERSECGVNI